MINFRALFPLLMKIANQLLRGKRFTRLLCTNCGRVVEYGVSIIDKERRFYQAYVLCDDCQRLRWIGEQNVGPLQVPPDKESEDS